MIVEIGKMYLVKEYNWFLYPTKEMTQPDGWSGHPLSAVSHAKYLKMRHNVDVSFFEPNTYIVVLEVDEDCCKLLDSNGNIGWLRTTKFFKYLELHMP